MNITLRVRLAATLAALLSACSGGSDQPPADLPPPPPPPPSAGTLAFSSGAYDVHEGDGLSGFVLVTRSGGSAGLVTAKIRLQAQTATAVDDFDTTDVEVMFGDRDMAPRLVPLPIVSDPELEGDETLTLALHSPAGCASIGTQASAEITILDDDYEASGPTVHTIGGSVTGLAGSGLVLTNLSTDDLPIGANGTFVFQRDYPNGFIYQVRVQTQPTNPRQTCTVTNGGGAVAGADVTNIQVDCVTLPDNGALDLFFGTDGRVTSGTLGGATAVALQSDGRILVVGADTLVRYTASGTVDTSFGTNGAVAVDVYGPGFDRLNAVAVQADGRIVVAGYSRDGANSATQEDFIVARYNGDGSVDGSFGTNGKVVTDFEARGDSAYEVLIQPDGAVVVTGNASVADPFGLSDANFAAVRYTSTGVLDRSFGTAGRVTTNVGGRTDLGYAAALLEDGKIVLAGRVANSGGANPDIGVVRYNANGSLDTSFANAGVLRDATADWDEAADILVQPDGRVLVIGLTTAAATTTLTLVRYNGDGSYDLSFGSNGRLTSAVMEVGRAIVLRPDGAIIAVGRRAADFAITRFATTGVLDTSFGANGILQVDFFGAADTAHAVGLQADGKIVVAGAATNGTVNGLGLIRLLP